VALGALLDLEKEVVTYGATAGLPAFFPEVGPRQLRGLEVNAYAHQLAQVAVWIAYLQWMTANGFQPRRDPILQALDTIRLQDALLDRSDPAHPQEAAWPEAAFIIGNPPFLGGNRIRQELGNEYVAALFKTFERRVPAFADLVCYFFEKARAMIAAQHTERAGLLATNSIRGGVNRRVLERIKETGDIFMAWSDEPWVLEGAAVRISIVEFDDGSQSQRELNGISVVSINPDLTGSANLTGASRLKENQGICFIGTKKAGAFDIDAAFAASLLSAPQNPNGQSNNAVVFPWLNGQMIVRRMPPRWIISFGEMGENEASLYELPYEYARTNIYPERQKNNEERARVKWWQHRRPATDMREAVARLERFIATPRVSKFRLFAWVPSVTVPDDGIYVFARDDDYFFGVLHARAHELWSLRMGTWLGVGNDPRYTPTTTFETYPFPWPPGTEPTADSRVVAIAEAARRLVELRDRWLNPPDTSEAELKKRTLTNLYNARPTWLADAHTALDRAVFDAYGWPHDLSDDDLLARLLALNVARAAP